MSSTLDYIQSSILSTVESSWEDYYLELNGSRISYNEDLFNESMRSNSTIFSSNTSSIVFGENISGLVIIALLSLLIVLTIVGNVLVCIAVVLVRKLRKPQNYLLVSLAISDLFVALSVMPFALIYEVYYYKWPLSTLVCDLWVSADVLCCTASILNLCAISVDRYLAITSPLDYSSDTSPKRMLTIIFSIWLGSACVSLPPVLVLGNEHTDQINQISICTVSQNFWYQIYATMGSFYVPLFIMIVLYLRILRLVGIKKKVMKMKPEPLLQHQPSNQSILKQFKSKTIVTLDGKRAQTRLSRLRLSQRQMSMTRSKRKKGWKFTLNLKEHKASATLGIIMSAFIICWLPFFVLALLRPFSSIYHFEIPHWVSSLFLWLGYTNSALNPVIYATLNRDFRGPFREILCLRCSTLDSLMRKEFYKEQYGGGKCSNVSQQIRAKRIGKMVEETQLNA